MTKLERRHARWAAELEKVECGYADALEAGAEPVTLGRMEGMIAAYQRIIADTAR